MLEPKIRLETCPNIWPTQQHDNMAEAFKEKVMLNKPFFFSLEKLPEW